ncbi:MAG: GTP-binding protein, partial [Actinomycetota bacterium]
LLVEKGVDIFRMKGIINVENSENRFVFQGVHMLFDGQPDRAWKPNEPRVNKMIFIGRNLDRDELDSRFRACLVK